MPPSPRKSSRPAKSTRASKRPTVVVIPGDGIGPEITRATLEAMNAAGAELQFAEHLAGVAGVEAFGDPLPPATLAAITTHRLALKGPLATPIGGGFRSVNVALRQQFDLFANVRPVASIKGVATPFHGVDLVVVRENTEDLYAGIEHYVDLRRSAAESICVITRHGSERIIRYAFEYAEKKSRKKITLIHKANILKLTNGLFVEVGRQIAKEYPKLVYEEMIVDASCMKLVTNPKSFDVIVTMNLFGDILSDLTAGLVGGLGVAPAANLGAECAIFEAVHGTAPDIAGKGLANPSALMLSAALLLEHVGQNAAGARLRAAVLHALENRESRTRDLGGLGDTKTFTKAVLAELC